MCFCCILRSNVTVFCVCRTFIQKKQQWIELKKKCQHAWQNDSVMRVLSHKAKSNWKENENKELLIASHALQEAPEQPLNWSCGEIVFLSTVSKFKSGPNISEICHHEIWEPKVTSSNVLFCPTYIPKLQDIQLTVRWDKIKQHIWEARTIKTLAVFL